MRKRLWDLAKSRIEIGTILPGHRHKVHTVRCPVPNLSDLKTAIVDPWARVVERAVRRRRSGS